MRFGRVQPSQEQLQQMENIKAFAAENGWDSNRIRIIIGYIHVLPITVVGL